MMRMILFICAWMLIGFLWNRRKKRATQYKKCDDKFEKKLREDRVILSDVPDLPIPFGYKISWLAIPTEDTEFIAKALGLRSLKSANWESGLQAAYVDYTRSVFVTPSVAGWTFVVGFALGEFGHSPHENKKFLDFIKLLGKKIPNFYYFVSYRVVDYFGWISIQEGLIKRAYISCDGEPLYQVEDKTREEEKLNFNFFDSSTPEAAEEEYYERKDLKFPDEEDVLKIASAWSINTQQIGQFPSEKSLGIVGDIR